MMIFGAIYFAVPRLTGRAWASAGLVRGHAALAIFGVVLLVVSLAAAGWTQSRDLLDAKVAFSDIAVHTRGWLLAAVAAQGMLLLGNLLLLVNFCQSVCACCCATTPADPALFRQPSTMEAPAS